MQANNAGRYAPLRIPVKVSESYVRSGDEQKLFPNITSFLNCHEVLDSWPTGVITHELFTYQGLNWRLHSRRAGGPTSPLQYLAILDSGENQLPLSPPISTGNHHYNSQGRRTSLSTDFSSAMPQLRSPSSPCSRPLMDIDCNEGGNNNQLTCFTSKSPLSSQALSHHQGKAEGSWGTPLALSTPSQNQNKFTEDLLTAESSHNAMER
jgi:hypothetical protein